MRNPTIVVVTDRNDLDGQLFRTFSHRPSDLLGEHPVAGRFTRSGAAGSARSAGRSGGIVFTTIQKFSPDEMRRRLSRC